MKPSVENQIASVKQQAGTPQKQFTREEIEKHDKETDCWLVIDNNVYDATSVLSWHPGGNAAILGHAGKVHQQTTEEFSSVHDGYAYQKLKECVLGVVTEKTAKYMKAEAEAAAKENAKGATGDGKDVVLKKHRWVQVTLERREELSEDTRQYTFRLPNGAQTLGLETCQHVQIGFHMQDKMLIRSYTPTRPLIPASSSSSHPNGIQQNGSTNEQAVEDGQGTFRLVVKTYFPNSQAPGGAMSNLLDCLQIGEKVEVKGPTGEIIYHGNGKFDIEGELRTFNKVSLILGGSGITPGYALIARVIASGDQAVQLRVIDANKSEKDILLHDELSRLEEMSKGRLKVTHVLSHPASKDWKGLRGHVNEGVIKDNLFPAEEGSVALLCGPPTMVQKAALPALRGKCSQNVVPFAHEMMVLLTIDVVVQIGGMLRMRMCLDFDDHTMLGWRARSSIPSLEIWTPLPQGSSCLRWESSRRRGRVRGEEDVAPCPPCSSRLGLAPFFSSPHLLAEVLLYYYTSSFRYAHIAICPLGFTRCFTC